MARQFRIAHAKITLEGMGEHAEREYFRSSLQQSWIPGTQVTRYERSWRLSKSTQHDEGTWHGHLGFVKEGELSTLNWDDSMMDFIRGEASSGVVVPFLIDESSRVVTFQLVSGKVRTTTVTSNLQALLNAGSAHYWKIEPLSLRIEFDDWKNTVAGITEFRGRLFYPNPNWTGRKNLEALMDGLRANTITIRARADTAGSLDTDSDWFQQAIDHVRLGYGRIQVSGMELESGEESRFILTEEGGAMIATDKIEATREAEETSPQELKAAQSRLLERNSELIPMSLPDEEDHDGGG